jgi:centrosomal protein CEP76
MTSYIPTLDLLNNNKQLSVEILSVKGLSIINGEHNESLNNIQLHVLFEDEIKRSNEILNKGQNEIVFNYNEIFPLKLNNSNDQNEIISPLLIYITTKSIIGNNQLPIGADFTKTLIATASIDYRLSNIYTDEYIHVELVPCNKDGLFGDDLGYSLGSLYMKLSILDEDKNIITNKPSSHIIQNEIENDLKILSENCRFNHQSVRSWLTRIHRDYPHIERRKLNLISEDESGQHRLVCSYISPIYSPRDFDSPSSCARFVSLIPFKREISLTGGKSSIWQSPHSMLTTLQGDVEDHAILLCCLLLGWGMNAWIGVGLISTPGSNIKRPHMWVVTLDSISDGKVIFWECLTGQKYNISIDTKYKEKNVILFGATDDQHPFLELHSIFRNDVFLLNTQRSPLLSMVDNNITTGVSFDLNDESSWMSYSPRNQKLLSHPGSNFILTSSLTKSRDFIRDLEINLELNIKNIITGWRSDVGLKTYFDDKLSLILQPALLSYELDRTLGVSLGNNDFKSSVKRLVEKGQCFKAFPTCLSHCNITTMTSALRQAAASKEIIFSRSTFSKVNKEINILNPTKHAIRIKIFPYPEGTMAVWLMLAVCFTE